MKETYNERELRKCQNLVGDLLEQHWNEIQGALVARDDSKMGVSLAIKLDHSGSDRELKAKITYAIKTSDEVETVVSNPEQEELPI